MVHIHEAIRIGLRREWEGKHKKHLGSFFKTSPKFHESESLR